jgi:hypothetical protein
MPLPVCDPPLWRAMGVGPGALGHSPWEVNSGPLGAPQPEKGRCKHEQKLLVNARDIARHSPDKMDSNGYLMFSSFVSFRRMSSLKGLWSMFCTGQLGKSIKASKTLRIGR